MRLSEKKLREAIREKIISEFKQGRTGDAYDYLSGLGYGRRSKLTGDDEEELYEIEIGDLPSQVGRTKNFVYQSIPCNVAVGIAQREADIWDQNNWYENDAEAQSYLTKYWESVGWTDQKRWNIKKHYPESRRKEMEHWSAAFISWVMQHENGREGGPNWKSSSAHSTYIGRAWRDRAKVENDPSKYKGKILWLAFTGEEIIGNGKVPPYAAQGVSVSTKNGKDLFQPGDLIGRRKGWKKQRSDGSYASTEAIHFDLYIGDNRKVGGNTYGGASRGNHYGDPDKENWGGKGTSGRQRANSSVSTDVIKRVKILGSIEDYLASGIKDGDLADVEDFEMFYDTKSSKDIDYTKIPSESKKGVKLLPAESIDGVNYSFYKLTNQDVDSDGKPLEIGVYEESKGDFTYYLRSEIEEVERARKEDGIYSTLEPWDPKDMIGDTKDFTDYVKLTSGLDPQLIL